MVVATQQISRPSSLNRLASNMLALIAASALGGVSFLTNDVAPFNQQRLLELSLIFLLSLMLISRSSLQLTAVRLLSGKPSTLFCLLILFLLGGILAIRSIQPEFAFLDLGHYVLVFISTLAVAAWVQKEPKAQIYFLAGLAIGAGVAAARYFIQVGLTLTTGISSPLLEWDAPYSNPRFFAQALVWALPLLALLPSMLAGNRHARLLRPLAAAVSIGSWTLLIWSGSRGALLGLAIGFTGLWLLLKQPSHLLRRPMLRHLLLGVLIWAVINSLLGWDSTHENGSLSLGRLDSSGRDLLIRHSWGLIQQHPWLGIGPGQFPAYHLQPPDHFESHPHNLILQVAVEWGVPACLLMLMLMLHLGHRLIHAIRALTPDPVNHALLLSLIASAVLCLVDGPHIMPLGLIGLTLGLGTLIGRTLRPHDANLPPRAIVVRAFCILVILLAWALVAPAFILHPACASYPLGTEKLLPQGPGYDNPRFWVQGRMPVDSLCLEPGRYAPGWDRLRGVPLNGQPPF